jgi:hypothetical protein
MVCEIWQTFWNILNQWYDQKLLFESFFKINWNVRAISLSITWYSYQQIISNLTHSTPDLSRWHHLHTFSQKLWCGWENVIHINHLSKLNASSDFVQYRYIRCHVLQATLPTIYMSMLGLMVYVVMAVRSKYLGSPCQKTHLTGILFSQMVRYQIWVNLSWWYMYMYKLERKSILSRPISLSTFAFSAGPVILCGILNLPWNKQGTFASLPHHRTVVFPRVFQWSSSSFCQCTFRGNQ